MLKALTDTPFDGTIPTEVLMRLPEWSIYIETPGMEHLEQKVNGFFAFLDYDTETGETYLQTIFDTIEEDGYHLRPEDKLPITGCTLKQAFRTTIDNHYAKTSSPEMQEFYKKEAELLKSEGKLIPLPELPCIRPWEKDPEQRREYYKDMVSEQRLEEIVNNGISEEEDNEICLNWESEFESKSFAPFLSLLLYLCSSEPEIASVDPKSWPKFPTPKKCKGEWVLQPPAEPKIWAIGQKTGEILRNVHENTEPTSTSKATSRRAHIRRAHWHGFWSGPIKPPKGTDPSTYKRNYDLKWLHPMIISPFSSPH
jgi:hypothetical protein